MWMLSSFCKGVHFSFLFKLKAKSKKGKTCFLHLKGTLRIILWKPKPRARFHKSFFFLLQLFSVWMTSLTWATRGRWPMTGTEWAGGTAPPSTTPVRLEQGVTKRCRLSWLTNSALVYEPECGGSGGVAGSQPMSTAVHRSPNKLWRSNSIFNLWVRANSPWTEYLMKDTKP